MKAHPIREVMQHFILSCREKTGMDPEVDAADAAMVGRRLQKYDHENICKMIDFYLQSEKAEKNGITLKACLSTHSVNLFKAKTNNTKETLEAKRSYDKLVEDIERSQVRRRLHITDQRAREIVFEIGKPDIIAFCKDIKNHEPEYIRAYIGLPPEAIPVDRKTLSAGE